MSPRPPGNAPDPTLGADDAEARGEQAVLGLDNVPLELPVASLGTRVVAASVDYLVVSALAAVWVLTGLFVLFAARSMWVVAVILLGMFVIEYGYFAGCEVLMDGRTPGKRLVGLRVVMRHGGRPTRGALLVRNCVRSVDLILGPVLMIFDPLARRLGDRLADTLVVHVTAAARAIMVERLPRGWGPAEAAIVESFFRRLNELEPVRAEDMAARLLAAAYAADPALRQDAVASEPPVAALRRALAVDMERR